MPTRPRFPGSAGVASWTGLRAVAVFLVVGTHAAFATGALAHGYVGMMLARLEIGVAIFFVLSGFLLFRPWVHSAATGCVRPPIGDYARRRVRRVMPAYVITVMLAYGVYSFYSAGPNPAQNWVGLMRHLTLTQIYTNNYLLTYLHPALSQTWSLAVEVAFYAVLPLLAYVVLVMFCRGRWQPAQLLVGLAVLAGIGPLWLIVIQTTGSLPNSAGMWLPAHLALFAGGMALAVLETLGVRCRADVALALALLAYLAASSPIAGTVGLGPARWWEPVTRSLLYTVIATLVVASVVLGGGRWIGRLLGSRPMVWLGGISYEIFLLHVLVMALVMGVVLRWPLFTGSLPGLYGLTMLITVPAAWALHRLTVTADRRLPPNR